MTICQIFFQGARSFFPIKTPEQWRQNVQETLALLSVLAYIGRKAQEEDNGTLATQQQTHDEEVLVSDPPTVFEALFYRCI